MTTIATFMPIFNKPGPLRDLVTSRGWRHVCLADPERFDGAPPADPRDMLLAAAPETRFLISGLTPLDAAFFAAAPQLKLVAMFGVGVDHIDLEAAARNGTLVTNVPGGNARCVAELAFALMLDLAHRVSLMHTDLQSGRWRARLGFELAGKTLGIVGLGQIGQTVAGIGRALGMNVIAANRSPRPEVAAKLRITQVSLDDVLSRSDVLTLHIPGGPDSFHFGAQAFARMKKGALLINTARGDLVDLEALADALESRHLAGAGLDVFPSEPMPMDHRIFRMEQVVCTPHAGGLSREAMRNVTDACLGEVEQVLARKRSPNACNPEVYAGPAWKAFQADCPQS